MFISHVTELLLFFVFLGGLCVANEEDVAQVQEYPVDEGANLTLPCGEGEGGPVYWIHEGRTLDSTVQADNSLLLQQVKREDSGLYKCTASDTDQVLHQLKVIVRTVPPRLVNVTVHPSTILALLRWDVEDTGGYPLTHFTAQYRLKHSFPEELPDEWHRVIPGRISPSSSQIDVYKLKPNSTYIFEVWASNELGDGEIVQVEATTHHNNEEIELGKHLLQGAETFDTRYWVAAVAVVMGTLLVLALGTCFVLYREFHLPLIMADDHEIMELVPNIILNPGYDHSDPRMDWIDPDENANNHRNNRLNNNFVVRPFRV